LLARGHQVCVLLPSDGCTYLQNSAFLMLSALDYMVQHSPPGVRIPVMGFSAGGIIARWALLHHQYHSQDYRMPPGTVNAYLSFDTPHRGANVPLSLQCFVNMLAGGISFVSQMLTLGWLDASKSVAQIVAMRSPAARQLALYHLGESAPNGKHAARCDPLRTELLGQMGEGWAHGIPKHAYANGPGNGIPFERAMPRETILGFAGSNGLAFHAMPCNGEGGDVFTIGPSWARGFWYWVEPGGQPLDSAPGSRTSFFQSGVDFLDLLYVQSVLPESVTNFLGDLKIVPAPSCFVPTTSALNQTDDVWYGAPQSPTSPPVPFDSFACAPDGTHERHVQVTDAATRYVLGCIPPP